MFEREPAYNPEKTLWQEVLYQAIQDALYGIPAGCGINKENRINKTKEARQYLTTPSKDLSMVCNLAGLDMQAVIKRMREQIANASTPEELITAKRVNRLLSRYTHNGESLTLTEWSDRTGISRSNLYNRIRKGMTIDEAINAVSDAKYRPKKNAA